MPVKFTSQTGGDPVQEIVGLTADLLPTPQQMLHAAQKQIERIKQRTASGVDANGNPFAPYAPVTVKLRQRKGLSTSPVSLRETGNLLDTMRGDVLSPTSFQIIVDDQTANQYGPAQNYGTNRIPARRFFDTSEEDLEKMLLELQEP